MGGGGFLCLVLLWIFGVRYPPGHKGVGILRTLLFSRDDIHDIKCLPNTFWEITLSALHVR